MNGHWRQLQAIGDIANGEDVFGRGAAEGIDFDGAVGVAKIHTSSRLGPTNQISFREENIIILIRMTHSGFVVEFNGDSPD